MMSIKDLFKRASGMLMTFFMGFVFGALSNISLGVMAYGLAVDGLFYIAMGGLGVLGSLYGLGCYAVRFVRILHGRVGLSAPSPNASRLKRVGGTLMAFFMIITCGVLSIISSEVMYIGIATGALYFIAAGGLVLLGCLYGVGFYALRVRGYYVLRVGAKKTTREAL